MTEPKVFDLDFVVMHCEDNETFAVGVRIYPMKSKETAMRVLEELRKLFHANADKIVLHLQDDHDQRELN